MKKSILMAIVALALLAAPAFAGDYSITANIDWGFGASIGTADQVSGNGMVTNDYTQLGFVGSIDDFNTLSITTEYGSSGGATAIGGSQLAVEVTDFHLTTDILGAVGVTDVPVTLALSAGFGRANLHNRFQQWTGWEIKAWKNYGAAHFAGSVDWSAWLRENYITATVGIMDMVNVAFTVVPYFNATYTNLDGDNVSDVPVMIEIWTSGIMAGPAALDISANLRADGYEIATGAQVTANMNFGALSLLAFVGDNYTTSTDTDLLEGYNNALFVAVKPSYNFGAGSVALGVWFGMTTMTDGYAAGGGHAYETVTNAAEDSINVMDLAVDVSLSYATFGVYGGVIMHDLGNVEDNDDNRMKYDIGVKNSFGAATLSLGVTGVAGIDDATGSLGALNDFDLGAADGSGNNWADLEAAADGDVVYLPTLYFRVNAWY